MVQARDLALGLTDFLPRGHDPLEELVAPADYLIEEHLDERTVSELRTLARELGWDLKARTRAEIVDQLFVHYQASDSGRIALGKLSESDRRLLALLDWIGPGDVDDLSALLDSCQDVLPDGWLSGRPGSRIEASRLESRIHHLLQRGLAVGAERSPMFTIVGVPSGLAGVLPPVRELTPVFPELPNLEVNPARDLIGDLAMAWAFLTTNAPIELNVAWDPAPLRLHARRWPATGTSKAGTRGARRGGPQPIDPVAPLLPTDKLEEIAGASHQDGPDSADWLVSLLARMGAVKLAERNSKLVADADRFASLLASGPDQLIVEATVSWLRMPFGLWDELSWIQRQRSDWRVIRDAHRWLFDADDLSQDLGSIRTQIAAKALAWASLGSDPTENWVDISAFSDILHGSIRPKLARTPEDSNWYQVSVETGEPLDPSNRQDWRRGTDPLLRYMLDGPLRWLGIVETARNADGTVAAARLTEIGQSIADRLLVVAEPEPQVRWTDSSTAEVTPSMTACPALRLLVQCAEVVEVGSESVTYRLSSESVGRSFAAGATPSELCAGLEAAGLSPPTETCRQIEEWWSLWGSLRTYKEVAMIELADEVLARELLATTHLSDAVVYECSPTRFLVEERAIAKLLIELEAAGHKPRLIEDEH